MINNVEDIKENLKNSLENVRENNPLTHCITNSVTINDCANAVLAIGGSPIMAEDEEEMEEVVEIADVLVINIGKLSKEQIKAMNVSAAHATKTNTPIVLDPVGAGISQLRNNTIKYLVENNNITAIRGNISEIKAIANIIGLLNTESAAKGVDVSEDDIISRDNLEINGNLVKELAKKLDTVVIASGPLDIISNGETTIVLDNGDEMMPLITGSGCMLTSIVGSCVAVNDPFEGSILASIAMSLAGEKAREQVDENNLGTGSFRTFLIDYLYKTNVESLINESKIEIL
ncbi:hydroxyethylthiazole kinase [Methanobrevibacter woesei]|uniref:Hydroxyethylthiazole kinase n=1 Tax=Methanobrevibacter woesei TaxID=190976 RepID=A0A2U1S743_9EURY|nr:hydroxyethylthiazole kinase [Methanobrevibacter woesei]MCC9260823.1 hydroxyethylthiazole kinase [Methanobrevibacter woesei]PWB85910.1 hydroxyethylthiazole kinase [Methanobrevibacter woesei]